MASDKATEEPVEEETVTRKSTRKTSSRQKAAVDDEISQDSSSREKTPKKAAAKKRKGSTTDDVVDANEASEKPTRKKKAPAHQVLTSRDPIPKLWDSKQAAENGSYTGIRALLKKTPNVIRELVDRHDLDVLCLQETKLQENNVHDPKLKIRETLGITDDYDDYWSCSTAKKGYSGTAVFVRKHGGHSAPGVKKTKQTTLTSFTASSKEASATTDETGDLKDVGKKGDLPIDKELLVPKKVSYGIDKAEHDAEGRTITVEFPGFSLCNVYVPNSGQKLERLTYRTEQWDRDFLAYMQTMSETTKKPVLWLGDLNVAHTNLEVWNDGAKHLAKQAGVTDEERASFQKQLDSGFIDAFRQLHPNAAGHYSYWSTRAGNRPVNKGLRLDYFVCHPDLFDNGKSVVVRDCFLDFEQLGSDHCPAILELELRGGRASVSC